MNKKGFLLITTLFTIAIISIIGLFVLNLTSNSIEISANLEDKLQAEYVSESVINILFAEHKEELNKKMESIMATKDKKIIIDDINLKEFFDAEYEIELKYIKAYKVEDFLLKVNSKYKGIWDSASAKGSIVNKIYLNENGVSSKDIDRSQMEFFESEISKIKTKELRNFEITEDSVLISNGLKNELYFKKDFENQASPYFVWYSYEIITLKINADLETVNKAEMTGYIINNGKITGDGIKAVGVFIEDKSSDIQADVEVRGDLIDIYDKKNVNLKYEFNRIKIHRENLPNYIDLNIKTITKSDLDF
ncbi:type II secretory pathway pseudopilin PulG [Peptoniphilus koenoeneniae]|uniref:Type II secretory pathway pseudopilin PulG n=1 Tax=Peptoniphilus koenoeneniae TaxID=507751 RepID=A0ABU0AT39_9FIRM|nr:type II secretion system protein [Peptoniphilus koenoeneniae]MDQ0274185.1 type II secretory pathway pseudopilin PulG [Peptoniphilus koenoeneniae]